jgi:DNA-directed RNA polymerase specialized sigma24 family protein
MQSVDADRVLAAAAAGNEIAWSRVVDSNLDRMWLVARSAGLSDVDAAEVCQLAWLRLSQRLFELSSPEQVAAYLIETVRREAGVLAAQRMAQERRRAGVSLPDNVIPLVPGFGGSELGATECDDAEVGAGSHSERPAPHAATVGQLFGPGRYSAEAGTDHTAPADVPGQTSAPPC